jgi:GntR family transcriptional regulator
MAGLLRARLAADEWEPGHRLPTVAALAADYQACHGTIRRALGRLQDEGLIVTLPRYGTFRSAGTEPRADPRAEPFGLGQMAVTDQQPS